MHTPTSRTAALRAFFSKLSVTDGGVTAEKSKITRVDPA